MDRLQTIDEVVEKYCVASSPFKSKLYIGTGSLFVLFIVFITGIFANNMYGSHL